MANKNHSPYRQFRIFAVGVAAIGIPIFIAAYFGVYYAPFLSKEWREFLLAIITNLIPTLLIFVLAYILYRRLQELQSEHEQETFAKEIADEVSLQFRTVLASLKDRIPSAEFSWLYKGAELLEFERKFKTKEIWILSPHLLNDTSPVYESNPGGASTVTTGQKNIRKGVIYTFIVPDTERIKSLLPQLRNNYRGGLRVIQIPANTFENIAFSEIAIYNPRMDDTKSAPRVFLELPVVVPHRWWVEVVDDVAYEILERARHIIDTNSSIHA